MTTQAASTARTNPILIGRPAQTAPAPIRLALNPLDALRSWPSTEPLAAIISLNPDPYSRWSIIARTAPEPINATLPAIPANNPQRCIQPAGIPTPTHIGFIPYELGHQLEPHAGIRPGPSTPAWQPITDAYIHDAHTDSWYTIGSHPELR